MAGRAVAPESVPVIIEFYPETARWTILPPPSYGCDEMILFAPVTDALALIAATWQPVAQRDKHVRRVQ